VKQRPHINISTAYGVSIIIYFVFLPLISTLVLKEKRTVVSEAALAAEFAVRLEALKVFRNQWERLFFGYRFFWRQKKW